MMLVERASQIAAMLSIADEVKQRRGRAIMVEGPWGVGRSALLNVVVDHLFGADFLVLAASALSVEHARPLALLEQVLDAASPFRADPALSQALESLRHGDGVDGDAATGGTGRDLIGEAASAAFMTLARAASRRPVAIVLDDIQDADESSRQLLLRIIARIRHKPILLIVTRSIPGSVDDDVFVSELLRFPGVTRMDLPPLSADAVAELVCERHPTLPSDSLRASVEALTDMTAGNVQLIRAVLDDSPLRPTEGDAPLAAVLSTPGPAYRAAVLGHLGRHDPPVLALARAHSILGDEASQRAVLALLEQGADGDAVAVERADAVLRQSGILHEHGFRHQAAAAAVLDAMPAAERRQLHSAAAKVLYGAGAAAPTVARHLIAAGGTRQPSWSLGVLLDAANEALRADDLERARRCLEFAFHESSTRNDSVAARLALARADWRSDPYTALLRVLPLTGDLGGDVLTVRQRIEIVRWLLRHGRFDNGIEALRALSQLPDITTDSDTADAYQALLWWVSSTYPAVAAAVDGMASAPRSAGAAIDAAASPLFQASRILDDVLAGRASAADTVTAEQPLRDLRLSDATIEPLGTMLTALMHADRLVAARTWCGELLSEATRRDVQTWRGVLSLVMADILRRSGDLAASVAYASDALAHISTAGWGVGVGSPVAVLIAALAEKGDLARARDYYNEAMPEKMAMTRVGLYHSEARGLFFLARGQPAAALLEFENCGERMTSWGSDYPALVPWRSHAAQALMQLDRPDDARRLACEQDELLGESAFRLLGVTRRALAASSPRSERIGLLEQSVEYLRKSEGRLELVKSLTDLGSEMVTHGTRAAFALFEEAIALAEDCGAAPAVRRLRHLMGETGDSVWSDSRSTSFADHGPDDVVPRRWAAGSTAAPYLSAAAFTASCDPGSPGGTSRPSDRSVIEARLATLTEGEMRVATLVADGRTNREVATELFVTVSTVEQHLTKIYRKLRINSRGELKEAGQRVNRQNGSAPRGEPASGSTVPESHRRATPPGSP